MTDQNPPIPPEPPTPEQSPPPPPASGPPPTGGGSSEYQTAMWAHLGGAILSVLCVTSFVCWVPSLIIFMMHREKSRFVAFHALQATFLFAVIALVSIILCPIGLLGLVIVTGPVGAIINIAGAVYGLIIGLKAKEGEWAEYAVLGKLARDQIGS